MSKEVYRPKEQDYTGYPIAEELIAQGYTTTSEIFDSSGIQRFLEPSGEHVGLDFVIVPRQLIEPYDHVTLCPPNVDALWRYRIFTKEKTHSAS